MGGDECRSVQLIDGDGEFNVPGVVNFLKATMLAECGLSYAVVSIMGPQSSGKSTLLNQLFGTDFREMDAFWGSNPLLVLFVGFLFFKALWVQLDISDAFKNGMTYGILSLSTTFLPDVMSFLKRFAEQGQGQPNVPQITQQNTTMDSQCFRRDSHLRIPSANPVPGASSSSSTYSSPRSGVECPSTSHGGFEARPWGIE